MWEASTRLQEVTPNDNSSVTDAELLADTYYVSAGLRGVFFSAEVAELLPSISLSNLKVVLGGGALFCPLAGINTKTPALHPTP